MRHKKFQEWILLQAYDELGSREREELERHLGSCAECRSERDRVNQFHRLLAARQPVPGTDGVLQSARDGLRAAINREGNRPRHEGRIASLIGRFFEGGYRPALAGALCLAAGIAVGRYLLQPGHQAVQNGPEVQTTAPVQPGDTHISNVRFVNSNLESGSVEFTFDAVRPVHVKGNINDEQVQKIMMHALLTEDNPGVRLRSVSTIAALGSKSDIDIKTALITSLKTDENAGVRGEALKTLRHYPMDNDIREAFLFVLGHDKNPGIRIAAINCLDSTRVVGASLDRGMLEVLRERMNRDDNNYIRLRAKAVIEEVRQ
jgi:hypothetical protein